MEATTQFRMTRQRRAILEAVRAADSHPTADEVYAAVRRRLPRISLGTVYRNLDELSRLGLIAKAEVAGTQKRFDGDTANHCHLRCLSCGRVDDAPGTLGLEAAAGPGELRGYRIVGRRVEFVGHCPRCRQSNREAGL